MIRRFQNEKANELANKKEQMKAEQEQLQNQISDFIDKAGMSEEELSTAEAFKATYEKYKKEMEQQLEQMLEAMRR